MTDRGNRKPLRMALVAAAALAAGVGIAIFRLWSGCSAPATHLAPRIVAPTTPDMPPPRDVLMQIAALEQVVRDLADKRRDIFLKLREARNQANATNSVWLVEIQRARQELEAALDAHPAVTAAKGEMHHILDELRVADTNSAAVLTRLHQKRNTREAAFKTDTGAIWARVAEERKKAMVEIGKTDMRKLTEAEADRLVKIQERAQAEFLALSKQNQEQKKIPDEEEQRLKSEFDALRSLIDGKSLRYAQLYNSMSALRASLYTQDPAIAAMDQNLTALNTRRQAVLNANPDTTGYLQQIAQLDKQRLETAGKLRMLRIQSGPPATAAASTNNVSQASGKKG